MRAREVFIHDAQMDPHDVTDYVRLILSFETTFVTGKQIIGMYHIFVLLKVILRSKSLSAHLTKKREAIAVVSDALFSCKHRCSLFIADCAGNFRRVFSLHVTFLVYDCSEAFITEHTCSMLRVWLSDCLSFEIWYYWKFLSRFDKSNTRCFHK